MRHPEIKPCIDCREEMLVKIDIITGQVLTTDRAIQGALSVNF